MADESLENSSWEDAVGFAERASGEVGALVRTCASILDGAQLPPPPQHADRPRPISMELFSPSELSALNQPKTLPSIIIDPSLSTLVSDELAALEKPALRHRKKIIQRRGSTPLAKVSIPLFGSRPKETSNRWSGLVAALVLPLLSFVPVHSTEAGVQPAQALVKPMPVVVLPDLVSTGFAIEERTIPEPIAQADNLEAEARRQVKKVKLATHKLKSMSAVRKGSVSRRVAAARLSRPISPATPPTGAQAPFVDPDLQSEMKKHRAASVVPR